MAIQNFPPSRAEALARLEAFVPRAGSAYARLRNVDPGPASPANVSRLSPYLRHRLLHETEALAAVRARHSASVAQKFIAELFWRVYWRGWLERRPAVWAQYRAGLARALDAVAAQQGLEDRWSAACRGDTGIGCFDHWARELAQTGYLHNHARMNFASIWIFTLGLPWELGADFFLRHLLDGDPASNTLSWRWVAGIQTPGKIYLARADIIARASAGRFNPVGQLARSAEAVAVPPVPPLGPTPTGASPDPDLRSGLLLGGGDLDPRAALASGVAPLATALFSARDRLSPLALAPHVAAFETGAMADTADRWGARMGPIAAPLSDETALRDWVQTHGLQQVVAPYQAVGPGSALLRKALPPGVALVEVLHPLDAAAWPHASHGFFRFADKIPLLLADLDRLSRHAASEPTTTQG